MTSAASRIKSSPTSVGFLPDDNQAARGAAFYIGVVPYLSGHRSMSVEVAKRLIDSGDKQNAFWDEAIAVTKRGQHWIFS